MRIKPAENLDPALAFQIAPMLNIVFVILMFFIAAYAAEREEKYLAVNLPIAEQGQPEFYQRQQLLLNLTATGEIFVESRQFSLDSLERRLTQLAAFAAPNAAPPVIIRADGACPHREITRVLEMCARAGIRNVYFAAQTSR